jgi:hypothetical protein
MFGTQYRMSLIRVWLKVAKHMSKNLSECIGRNVNSHVKSKSMPNFSMGLVGLGCELMMLNREAGTTRCFALIQKCQSVSGGTNGPMENCTSDSHLFTKFTMHSSIVQQRPSFRGHLCLHVHMLQRARPMQKSNHGTAGCNTVLSTELEVKQHFF